MPFNLLLMPLIAGYLFLSGSHLFAYATSLLEKEQLLLRASLAGLVLGIVSRVMCWLVANTEQGRLAVLFLYHLAPFPFIGTALGTLGLAYGARTALNYLVPNTVAGEWLYHSGRLNQLEMLLLRSTMGVAPGPYLAKRRLIWAQVRKVASNLRLGREAIRTSLIESLFPTGSPEPVMLTMRDSKVYVGYISELPPVTGKDLLYFRLIPIWSGYRSETTKEVVQVTSYLQALEQAADPSTLMKVLACADVSNANLFEDDLFEIPDADSVGTRLRSMKSATRPRRSRTKA
jgi:hypothetical protein